MPRQTLKILRPLLLLIAIAVVMLWLLGGRTHTWTVQLETDAEPDRIFRYITDPQRMTIWMSDVMQVEPLNELPLGVGARTRIVAEDDKGRSRIRESEIIEFEANRLLKARLEDPRFDATSTFIIEPKGDGYRLRQRVQARHKRLFRLVAPLFGDAVQEQLDDDFRSLQELLDQPEEGVTPTPTERNVTSGV